MGSSKKIVKVKDLKENPKEYEGKSVIIEGKLRFLGRSPHGDSFSVNLPPSREYEICIIKDDTGEIFACADEDLQIEQVCDKPVRIRGYLRRANRMYMFKITRIEVPEESKKEKENS